MRDLKMIDPFECTDESFEVDDATVARIEAGIRAADEGRFVTSDEARKLAQQWISKLSIQNPR